VLLYTPPETDVIRNSFLRDVLVYIAATVTIFGIALDGIIKLYEALLLLGLYFSYVALVVCTTRGAAADGEKRSDSLETDSRELSQSLLGDVQTKTGSGSDYFIGLTWEPDASIWYKIQYIIEFPFSVLRWLSIPSAESHWSRKHRFFASTGPVGTAAMILLDAAGTDGFTTWWLALPVLGGSAMLSVAVWYLTNDKDLPKFHFALVLLGFASTIVWLDVVANETVAVLEAFGIMINVSTSILGLTVLAMGNSIGDFVADVAVARAGQPTMGIASCFGSPLLNDVVGLGISLTVTTISDGDLTAHLNAQCRLAYIFLWVSLLSSLATFTYTGFTAPGKFYAFYLFGLYSLFLLMSCLHEAEVITWQF
jgi:sodium/potassium/calcium exchanger 6